MTLTFNIDKEQLQHELEEYNQEQAENAEFLSVVSRSVRQEQCTVLDDELSPTALGAVEVFRVTRRAIRGASMGI